METLPKLDYMFNGLEPYFDARTMEIHYTKHHQTYIDKYNAAVKGTEFEDKNVFDVITNLKKVPENIREAVRKFGGGHANHSFFWKVIGPTATKPSGKFAEELTKTFGSFDKFKEEFTNASLALFGSGWVWLVLDKKELKIMPTANQDSPLSEGKIPLLVIDLWEHSYYLKSQNRRADYIKDFWNVVNWDEVARRFNER